MWLFKKKSPPESFLKPGTCLCNHKRNCHTAGKSSCQVLVFNRELNREGTCACQIYIPKPDENDDVPGNPTPSPAELARMYEL